MFIHWLFFDWTSTPTNRDVSLSPFPNRRFFDAPRIEGPFCAMSQRVQVQQYDMIETCLGHLTWNAWNGWTKKMDPLGKLEMDRTFDALLTFSDPIAGVWMIWPISPHSSALFLILRRKNAAIPIRYGSKRFMSRIWWFTTLRLTRFRWIHAVCCTCLSHGQLFIISCHTNQNWFWFVEDASLYKMIRIVKIGSCFIFIWKNINISQTSAVSQTIFPQATSGSTSTTPHWSAPLVAWSSCGRWRCSSCSPSRGHWGSRRTPRRQWTWLVDLSFGPFFGFGRQNNRMVLICFNMF